MEATFKTSDYEEALRIMLSENMALFIYNISVNCKLDIDSMSKDEYLKEINEMLIERNIDIENLLK